MSDTVLEQEFQQMLRVQVTRDLGGRVRLWRQPAGRFETARGGFIEGAPVGAADLTGVVAPTGTRIEIEIKGARTPVTDPQVRWREALSSWGAAVTREIRYNPRINIDGNLAFAIAEVRRVVELAECTHPDAVLTIHPAGGLWCTRCGWRNGGRAREAAR